ncbi:hypothetical protein M5K25_022286 [Dendrobium thyrsiflorum]|uniref:Uncharacterized protein n=1 Tax=Dendrobium thyrsiflorum TaxID=117978 RepID=A0ABD0UC93_DENTH
MANISICKDWNPDSILYCFDGIPISTDFFPILFVSEKIHDSYRKLKKMYANLNFEIFNLQKVHANLITEHSSLDNHMTLLDEYDALNKKHIDLSTAYDFLKISHVELKNSFKELEKRATEIDCSEHALKLEGQEHNEPDFDKGEATLAGAPAPQPASAPIPPPAPAYHAYPHEEIIQRLERLETQLDYHIQQQRTRKKWNGLEKSFSQLKINSPPSINIFNNHHHHHLIRGRPTFSVSVIVLSLFGDVKRGRAKKKLKFSAFSKTEKKKLRFSTFSW